MEVTSSYAWVEIALLAIPAITLLILFFRSKERITKIQCVMAAIASTLLVLSYAIPKTATVGSATETAGISISFGLVAGFALLVIGLIEIKRFERKT